jgi:RNA exonuclease NGL2
MPFNYVRPMLALSEVTTGKHTFTVMSYNVLAQHLINRSYFPYASSNALRWATRKPNLAEEIAQINADIVCLQECSYYDNFWEVTLRNLGYKGYIKMRTNNKPDGCAVFFKQDKFEVMDVQTVEYNDLCNPNGSDKAEMQRENVALFLALKFTGLQQEQGLIIGNTHLFWNYRYNYVRMRQMLLYLETAHKLSEKHKLPFVLCGDFNLTPDSTLYQILTQGKPKEGHLDNFTYFEEYETSHSKDDVPPPTYTPEQTKIHEARIEHVLDYIKVERSKLPLLRSVYSNYQLLAPNAYSTLPAPPYTGEPPFTNFTDSFKGTLDYIFVKEGESKIVPQKLMDFPPLVELETNTALPNDVFSSDHLSIMCEFCVSS